MNFISTLTENQAYLVLSHLLRSNSSLICLAASIARDLVFGVIEKEISAEFCSAFAGLFVHLLWQESEGAYDGSVDPNKNA